MQKMQQNILLQPFFPIQFQSQIIFKTKNSPFYNDEYQNTENATEHFIAAIYREKNGKS